MYDWHVVTAWMLLACFGCLSVTTHRYLVPVFVLHMHSVCTCCSGLQEMWEGNVLMKWGLLSWPRHVGYTVSPIQAWIPKRVILMPGHCIICDYHLRAICQWVSDLLGWASCLLRAATQHPGAQALCPCWGVPQLGSSGCGWLPWAAAAPWGAWPCQPLWSHPTWWCGGPSMHAPLLQTSPGSLSGRFLSVLSAWSPAFSWSH